MKYNLAGIIRRTGTKKRKFRFNVQLVPNGFEKELWSIYNKVNLSWAEQIKMILPAYEAYIARVTDDETDALQVIVTAASDGVYRVTLPLGADVQAWEDRLEEWQRNGWIGAVKTSADVDVSVFTVREDVIDILNASLQNNVNLIRSLNEDQRRRTETAVWQAVQQQTPRNKLASILEEDLAISRRRAINIARDQTTKLGSALEKARQQEAELDQYIWVKSGKVHFRPEHAARNGKLFDWDKPPDDGSPGEAINCGCHAQAYLDLGDD